MRKKQLPRIPNGRPDAAGVTSASQYIGISASRVGETNLRWQRVGLFTALHIAGLGTVPFVMSFDFVLPVRMILVATISFFAIIVATVGLIVTNRGHEWIEFWNERLAELELGLPIAPVSIYGSMRFKEIHDRYLSFHHVLVFLCLMFIVVWSLFFMYSSNSAASLLTKGI